MISFELVPRTDESIKEQIEFIKSKPIFNNLFEINEDRLKNDNKYIKNKSFFNAVNVPDLIRFPTRSWEIEIPQNYDFIPHIRVIDFDLTKNTLFELIKNFNLKHVLLITGEKSSSYNRPVYNSSILTAIELLKKEFPDLIISVAVDQYRSTLKKELDYLDDKFKAGADYVFSQPFFDISLINYYLDYIPSEKLFIGISPVVSEKSKLYWENVNNVIFPKNFKPNYEWNIDFTQKVFREISFNHLYFMPIGVDLYKYFKEF